MEDTKERIRTTELIGPEGKRLIGLNAPYIPPEKANYRRELVGAFLGFGSFVALISPLFIYVLAQTDKFKTQAPEEKPPVPIEQIAEPLAYVTSVETAKNTESEGEQVAESTKWRGSHSSIKNKVLPDPTVNQNQAGPTP